MQIRTAILGYGRNGSTMHAGAVEAVDAFDMVAACDIDKERLTQAQERFECAAYEDYEEMLAKEDLDLVVIVTRTDQHCAMTCDCLEAGVNVLVTKPWAVNAAEAERMIVAAEGAKGSLYPWLPSRWGCDYRRIKELVDTGAIGKVFLIRRAASSYATRCDWQTERKYGGGYLLNWGPHVVDTPTLLGGSPPANVFGRLRQTINPGDGEDVFLAVITLEDGTLVQAEYTVSPEALPTWFVQGDGGAIVVRDKELTLCQQKPVQPGDPTQYATMAADEKKVQTETLEGAVFGDEVEIYEGLAQAIAGDAVYPVTPQDALGLTRLLDAIRRSSDENRIVAL